MRLIAVRCLADVSVWRCIIAPADKSDNLVLCKCQLQEWVCSVSVASFHVHGVKLEEIVHTLSTSARKFPITISNLVHVPFHASRLPYFNLLKGNYFLHK